jgi:hypothetical protein
MASKSIMAAVAGKRFARGQLLTIPLAIGITFLHYIYTCYVGLYLFEESGGVKKLQDGWTAYGGIDCAWTIPIHLPGTIALAIARKYHKQPGDGSIVLALIVFLAGSLLTSYVIASFALNLLRGESIDFGRLKWRAAVTIIGLSWIPVPVQWSFVYYSAIVY